jgi:hypothetical protein
MPSRASTAWKALAGADYVLPRPNACRLASMDIEELKLLPGFGRIAYSEHGKPTLKYRAIDPADYYVHCGCGKADCWTQQLIPLREHMVALFRAIVVCGLEDQFDAFDRSEDPWPGVIYALQMAASLEDVFADPSYVDDSEAAFWCRPAWESDEEDREAASKYAAALIIFNFAWTAYEAAIETSASGLYPKDKVPVRARRLFQAEPALSAGIEVFDFSYRVAREICIRLPAIASSIEDIDRKYALSGGAAAAELGRIFRNYIVHGADPMPMGSSRAACARFYSITRLLLLLIQLLVLRRLKAPARPVPLSANQDRGSQHAGRLLQNLHRPEALWVEPELMRIEE